MADKILFELNEIKDISKRVINLLDDVNILLFRGELGAGKTTLIKCILNEMGLKENVTSPTFSIVNEYELNEKIICHFDLYRIKSIEELHVIGFNEYIDSKKICFIEWPEIATDIIFYDYLDIYIKADINEKREITITKYYKK